MRWRRSADRLSRCRRHHRRLCSTSRTQQTFGLRTSQRRVSANDFNTRIYTRLRQRFPDLMRRLQSVLNAAARPIFNLRRSDHVSDALISLHWLCVC